MTYTGLIIGASAFIIIGIFHPIVIKSEYYFSKKIWPIFLIIGLICLGLSLFIKHAIFSPLLGIVGFTCLWSIKELFEQEERVKKGWFPENPKRRKQMN